MFVPHRVNVTGLLRGNDQLEIKFDSALLKARGLQKAHPDHKYLCWNGEPARLTTRKAQYHWGWDWGPVLMTAGPWRAVRLESFRSRIADLWTEYEVDIREISVSGWLHARIEGQNVGEVTFCIELAGEQLLKGTTSIGKDGTARLAFFLPKANLWYPHGYGKQPLYKISAVLFAYGSELDSRSKNTGFRHVRLVQQADKVGKSFFFRINGIDVFCGGSNWIPADNFTPRISDTRYRKWIQMMVDGNQHMIR